MLYFIKTSNKIGRLPICLMIELLILIGMKKFNERALIVAYSNKAYNSSQKYESTLLHTYVLNEFLRADRSFTTKYFWKNSYESWHLTSLRFFWHLLRPNWSIIRVTVSLWTFGRIAKSLTFSFDDKDLLIFKHVSKTIVSQIVNQFGRKRCQKNRKDVEY